MTRTTTCFRLRFARRRNLGNVRLLFWLLGSVLLTLALIAAALALVVWRLRRSNRVVPSVRSAAPLVWLVSPSSLAFAHRRLSRSVDSVRAADEFHPPADPTSPVPQLIDDLEAQAVSLDCRLVLARRLPRSVRSREHREIRHLVAQHEALANRVRHLIVRDTDDDGERIATMTDLGDRVRALEQGHEEVDRVIHRATGSSLAGVSGGHPVGHLHQPLQGAGRRTTVDGGGRPIDPVSQVRRDVGDDESRSRVENDHVS